MEITVMLHKEGMMEICWGYNERVSGYEEGGMSAPDGG